MLQTIQRDVDVYMNLGQRTRLRTLLESLEQMEEVSCSSLEYSQRLSFCSVETCLPEKISIVRTNNSAVSPSIDPWLPFATHDMSHCFHCS